MTHGPAAQQTYLPSDIQSALKRFEKEYTRQLTVDIPHLTPVFTHILVSHGKRTRPVLFFLFQAAFSGRVTGNEIIPVLIEMLHEASLIHDDVVDASPARRGHESMNITWGNKVAVLCGDYLMAKILDLGLNAGINGMMPIISRTAVNMGLGELRQAVADPAENALETAYYNTIRDKTGGLFSAACELGCLAGGAEPGMQLRGREFGLVFGTLFQIKDDLLDLTGSPRDMGKPAGQDLRDGKITLPLIQALQHRDSLGKKEIFDLLKRRSAEDIAALKQIIVAGKGIEATEREIDRLAAEAMDLLACFPANPYVDTIRTLVSANRDRKR
ncbi:polyprenyl synthetase family protein [bacterium]|nr:polyprenyl synthetase family protein [bacterium]